MRRYESLDSIRGIAALAVVFSHMFIVFPAFYSALSLQQNNQLIVDLLAFTPLHLLWSGHEAVVLFFILSGFVLSLPYLNNRKLVYTNYIVQRVFRIYIPYIVIILFSIILQSFLYTPGGIAGLSKWFNWMWMLPLSPGLFSHFLFMSGELTHNYNTASWSLVHEMRISLVFPFIVLLIRRKNLLFDLGLLGLVFCREICLADRPSLQNQ
ncbi:acyltransferase [Planococcus glaciei]|nr:acyltransferase [Planococcus glaciei]